jgi:flagellar biosynthesis chaperone FliJ
VSAAPRAPTTRADLRGLRWPYAALERKLDIALDRARLALAELQRKCAAGEQELRELQESRQDQLRALHSVALRAEGWDVHRGSLHFLAEALARLATREQAVIQLRDQLEEAQLACVAAHQRRETLQALRASAEAAHVQVQLRRQAKEADLAWLSRHGGAAPGEGAS